jgi:hypothetical protein
VGQVFKYFTARGAATWTISQRFLLDVSIRDVDARFELLNCLIVVEMIGITIVWWWLFGYNDHAFRSQAELEDDDGSPRMQPGAAPMRGDGADSGVGGEAGAAAAAYSVQI